MICLSIETSTAKASVALLIDEQIIEHQCAPEVPASTTILPLINRLLKEAEIKFSDIELIAIGAGPGAFTGVRLAFATAQGLALPHNISIIPICTLSIIAASALQSSEISEINIKDTNICVLLNAQMKEIYCATFATTNLLEPVSSINLASPLTYIDKFPEYSQGATIFCGNAISDYQEIYNYLNNQNKYILMPNIYPEASSLARIAIKEYANNSANLSANLTPMYVRNKVALSIAERLASGGKA